MTNIIVNNEINKIITITNDVILSQIKPDIKEIISVSPILLRIPLESNWDDIKGNQENIGLSGFTNDAGFITLNDVPEFEIPSNLSVETLIETSSFQINRVDDEITGISYDNGRELNIIREDEEIVGIEDNWYNWNIIKDELGNITGLNIIKKI